MNNSCVSKRLDSPRSSHPWRQKLTTALEKSGTASFYNKSAFFQRNMLSSS